MKKIIKITLIILFCFYLIILTERILLKYVPLTQLIHFDQSYNKYYWKSHNFIPFKTIIFYLFLADINLEIRINNLVGNVLGFMPFGFMLPLLSRNYLNARKVLLATFCLSLTYEILQLLLQLGSFDVDDLILNTFGGGVGYVAFKLLRLLFTTIKNKDRKMSNVKKGI